MLRNVGFLLKLAKIWFEKNLRFVIRNICNVKIKSLFVIFALKFLIGIANPLYIHSNDFEDMRAQAQKWTILFCTVHHSLFTYYSACVTKFKTLFWCFAFSIYTFHFETGTNSIKNSSLCFVGFAIFARLTYLLPGRPW